VLGDIDPRDGYWFNYYLGTPFTLRYSSQARTGNVDFTVDYPGWNILGYGHDQPNLLDNTSITHASVTDTFRNAWYSLGWLSGPLQTWDCGIIAYRTIGVDSPPWEWEDDTVRPWQGYWFNSLVPQLVWRLPLP